MPSAACGIGSNARPAVTVSQKYTGMESAAVTCWCSAISLP
jgi:hypothetical protein